MVDIIVPRRREDFFDDKGEPTFRLIKWMELVTQSNNDNTTIIEQTGASMSFSAQAQQQSRELDGLPEFTMDATGFTMDTTEFTMDKVIA